MARPCRHFGCANLVTERSQRGYCDKHAGERIGWAKTQAHKGNTTKRGYGHAWRKLRERILQRDNYLCQVCLTTGRVTPAHAVDHIKPKSQGGTDDEENLQAICHACHKIKTQAESKQGEGG